MASFNFGYQAICLAPNHDRKFMFYMVSQGILCILWFIFSIISAGSINGWTKIKVLSRTNCKMGFSIFLAVIESLVYLFTMGLGIYCLIRAKQVTLFPHQLSSTEITPSTIAEITKRMKSTVGREEEKRVKLEWSVNINSTKLYNK